MINQYKTQLIKKKKLAENIFSFKFRLIEPEEVNFLPGQYLFLKVNDRARLYSIASPDYQKNEVEFVIEIIEGGLASTYLKNLPLESQVFWYGPAGQFFLRKDDFSPIFLATGTGIAPIRSMILSNLKKESFSCFLLWGLRKISDIYFFDEFLSLKEKFSGRFDFVYCLSREEKLISQYQSFQNHFFFGHIQDYLNQNFKEDFFKRNFYLCGSRGVVESLKVYLKEKGVKDNNIVFERF